MQKALFPIISYSSRVPVPPGSVLDENKSGFPAFSGIARLTWLIDLFGDLTVTSATREKQKDKNYSRMTVHFQTANKKWVMSMATCEPGSSSSAGLLPAGVLCPLLLLWKQNGWRLAWKCTSLKMHFIIVSLISLCYAVTISFLSNRMLLISLLKSGIL